MNSKLFNLHRGVRVCSLLPRGQYHIGTFTNNQSQWRGLVLLEQNKRFLSSLMKPWDKYVYECDGDYRKETFLEDHIGGPLYEKQKDLPRLPIPSLEDTIKRFLPTALPLARTKEEEMALKAACKSFPEQAKVLHDRLNDRRENDMKDSSWLQQWWNQLGYLQVRDPVVVNVSYFFSFVDDPTVTVMKGNQPNVQRGAAILFATAQFRRLVITGQLPYERIGRRQPKPICSTAYKYMFNGCRIPYRKQDSYRIYDPSRHSHCIVARKGHFFSIEIVDKSGYPLPITIIEKQLEKCITLSESIPSSRPKLGVLTSSNRDDWADARAELLRIGGDEMKKALEKVESGAILLNLDDEKAVSRQECGNLFWTGGLKSGENRFFDKSIQIMVTNNGKAGLVAEHSMMDGMPMINYANFVTKLKYTEARRQSNAIELSPDKEGCVVDIFDSVFEVIDKKVVEKLVNHAWNEFRQLITNHSLHVQSFQAYGSSFIKKSGFPPDAFIQIAMQLATYRLFGEQVGTYEATQVRPFLHGRTEVTRAVSTESEAFVRRLGLRPRWDEDIPTVASEKILLLKKAVTAHAKYTSLAAKASGVDRHFLGLSLMAKDGEKLPSLYSDSVFSRSKHWRLSTSQLSHPRFNLWGYGEVSPVGVGLAYSILPESCVFCITALRSTGWTDKLSELLEEALLEMRRIAELNEIKRSKL